MLALEGRTDLADLCTEADFAWADGDVLTLREVTERLASRAPEPLHDQLLEVAHACISDPERALELWPDVKQRIPRGLR